jgi:hypothetical protein
MYSKTAITRPTAGQTHPFKIDISKKGSRSDGTPIYTLAVNFHSRLFTGMGFTNQGGAFLQWQQLDIQGLDAAQPVPSTFPGQNYYCVLRITVNNLQATQARIIWVSNDASVNQLQPVTFESSENRRQTEARIIIGVFVSDDEAIAGTDNTGGGAVNTAYIMQNINTNLLMCNMVFDGVPVVYPVPFAGGRLNANLF